MAKIENEEEYKRTLQLILLYREMIGGEKLELKKLNLTDEQISRVLAPMNGFIQLMLEEMEFYRKTHLGKT